MTQLVLEIENLHLSFPGYKVDVYALNHASLRINHGETVGVVGESGSGKPVTAMLIICLLPEGSYRIHQERVSLLSKDVPNASGRQMHQWRSTRVAMIFQGPMTALNPTRHISQQVAEAIRHHQALDRTNARQKAIVLLREMQIPDASEVMKRFPFEFSDGMRQRVMIALAFSCESELIIADGPTIALDVTMQLQVLRLLKLKARTSETAVLSISHDMAVVPQLCDRLYVMYAGGVTESGPMQAIIQRPTHPYSIGSLKCTPGHGELRTLLPAIPDTVPNLTCLPIGCAFCEHCFAASPHREETPVLSSQGGADQQPTCWYPQLRTTHV